MTIEDLMREQGQLVKKGTLSEDGDLEFWEDGSTTKRRKDKDTQPAKPENRESEVKGIE
jgi:protein import protein ZIM17